MESKFISDQTLGYLQAKAKIGTTDRIDGLEGKLIEVVEFLGEYEKYHDDQLKNLASQIEALNQKTQADHESVVSFILDERNALLSLQTKATTKIKAAIIIAVISAFFTIGAGVALWLIK